MTASSRRLRAEQTRANPRLAVLRAADDGVAAVASGYQLARNHLARCQESARREVFDALLAGGGEALAVLGRTAELGVDVAAPQAAFVVRVYTKRFLGAEVIMLSVGRGR
jgi:hypothetical protein